MMFSRFEQMAIVSVISEQPSYVTNRKYLINKTRQFELLSDWDFKLPLLPTSYQVMF